MEKTLKPVPDVEALRYKGTPEKPDIKIFVSHRIDLDSETIDNPLFIPVRCGAIYDDRENVPILGDDTGDNISEKRNSFCELTVQYWAWKNVKADYFGLCHYRRVFSFSQKHYEQVDGFNHIQETAIGTGFNEKYGINEKCIRDTVVQNDIISIIPADISKTLKDSTMTVYKSLKLNPNTYNINDIDLFVEKIKEKYPQLSEYVDEYMNGSLWRAFNCYIMRKEVFYEYCEMLYPLLFEIERELDVSLYSIEKMRQVGYMGEIFFAVFYLFMNRERTIKSKELQLVKIENTERIEILRPYFQEKNKAVVMAASDEYAPFLSVVLQSIRENANPCNNYDIIILSNRIKTDKKSLIKSVTESENIHIRFVEISSYLDGKELYTRDHLTPMTYVRLLTVDILRNYEKIVYLDCDIVVNHDIADLFDIELGDKYIAAVKDTVMSGWCALHDSEQNKYNLEELGLETSTEYFNGGVLLINIHEMRKKYNEGELFRKGIQNKYRWFDQDVLNIICEKKAILLSQKWNFMAHVYDVQQQLPEYFAPMTVYQQYLEAQKDPYIVHYAGNVIPCFAPKVDHAQLFWKYARNSIFYEDILSTLQRKIALSEAEMQNRIEMENQTIPRTRARVIADMLFPPTTRRRRIVKKIIPRDSLRWKLCKKMYYFFEPKYHVRSEIQQRNKGEQL